MRTIEHLERFLPDIKKLAKKHKWEELEHQENICLISYKKGDDRINVYYSRMTVGTAINHPKKGKTQLFRKHVEIKLLEKLFINPRTHTGLGYYTK